MILLNIKLGRQTMICFLFVEGENRFTHPINSLADSLVSFLWKQTYLEKEGLHHFPAVGSEKQVHCLVCQLAFVLQVGADQLPNGSGPVCPKELANPLH